MQSVFQHSRHDLDYIVIDGGSTDGTVDLIRHHTHRFKCWLSEEDDGVYDAMNKGWALADPESWILFLGAGDRLIGLPWESPIEESYQEVLFGHVLLDNDRVFLSRSGFRLNLYNSLHHQSLLIPKCLHPEPPFDLSYPLYADFDFNQRLKKAGVRFRFEPKLLAYAAPYGMSQKLQLAELQRIIHKNYGPLWSRLSVMGFTLAHVLPPFRILSPIRKASDQNGGRLV
jgi:glycosyltransferase involved in cell wall biosynthesis